MINLFSYWCFEQNYIDLNTPDEVEKVSKKKGKVTRDLEHALNLLLVATLR